MGHVVVYHNPDKMGEWSPSRDYFAVTKKPVSDCIDKRVWLISRRGKPRNYEYVLCMTFLVESAGANDSGSYPSFPYSVRGAKGKSFDPPVPIDKQEDWFQRLFRATRHFNYGLTHIRDEEILQGLSGLAKLP